MLLLAMAVTAGGLAGGLQLARRDEAIVFAVLMALWAAAGFSLGWTTSQWPFHRLGFLTLAAAGVAANWLFLLMLFYARRETWNEDAGESLAPEKLTALLGMLTGKSWPYWWTMGVSVVLPAAAIFRSRGILLATFGLSLVLWMTIGWIGFAYACDGYAWRVLPTLR
jgi:hypothetical protein